MAGTMDKATWGTFKRSDTRRGRRSNFLKVNALKTFDGKIAVKKNETTKDPFTKELLEQIKKFLAVCFTTDIVAYGIGAILESPVSQYQYAVFLQIKEISTWEYVGSYDPVSSQDEIERMATDGIQCASFPYSRIETESRCCFFYMPHCEAQTYSELLMDIKQTRKVSRFLIFGSDLQAYNSDALQCVLKNFRVEMHPIFTEFNPRSDVFNDCYLQELTLMNTCLE